MNATEQTKRQEYIDGLRAVADLLTVEPDLPLPTTDGLEWAVYADTAEESRAMLATIARLIPGRLDKNDPTRRRRGSRGGGMSGEEHLTWTSPSSIEPTWKPRITDEINAAHDRRVLAALLPAVSSPCPSLWQRTPEWAIGLGALALVAAMFVVGLVLR